jgi:hypothetical protein
MDTELLNVPRYPSHNIHAPPTALKFWQNKTLHVDSEPPQLTSSAYYHTELHTGVTEGGDYRCLTARRIRVGFFKAIKCVSVQIHFNFSCALR